MKRTTFKLSATCLMLLFGLLSYSQVTVTISNMAYISGDEINNGGPIQIENGGSSRIQFGIEVDNPNGIQGTLRVNTNSNGNDNQQGFDETIFSGNTSYSSSKDITLDSDDFNTSGDVLYAEFETTSGIKYKSINWSIEIIDPDISNNSISGNQSIITGQAPSTITGSNPSGGSGSYNYQWQKKTTGSWSSISGATSQDYSPGSLTTSTQYRRVVSSGSVSSNTSNSITVTVSTVLPISGNSISTNQTILSGQTPSTLTGSTPNGGNGSFSYSWQKKATGNWSAISGATSKNYAPSALTTTTQYRRIVSSGTVSNSTSNVLTITIVFPITGNSISANQTITEGEVPSTVAGSTPSGGNGNFSYNWQSKTTGSWATISGATSKNYAPGVLITTTQYRRRVTSGGQQSTSNTITITVNPAPPINNNTFTFNGTSTLIGSTPTGGIGAFSYKYHIIITNFDDIDDYSSSISGNKDLNLPSFILNLINDPSIYIFVKREVFSGNNTSRWPASGLGLDITPPHPITGNSISASQTIIEGETPAILIGSTPGGGGGIGSYTYLWQSKTTGNWITMSGATSRNYSPSTLTTTTQYRRIVSSGSVSNNISNTITVAVIPPIIGNSISANQTIFEGLVPATLVGSTPSGGTESFTYLWQSKATGHWSAISGATSKNYSPSALTTTTQYRRKINSSGQQSTSNTVTITVNLTQAISNNTIVFDGVSTMIGSVATGGNGVYTYGFYLIADFDGGLEYNQSATTNKDFNIPALFIQLFNSGVTVKITRTVHSGNRTSTTGWVFINDAPIENNTFAFDGVSTLIGSVPTGGNGLYSYQYHIIITDFDEIDDYSSSVSGNKDLNIPSYILPFIDNPSIHVFALRKVWSGNEISTWPTGGGLFGGLEITSFSNIMMLNPTSDLLSLESKSDNSLKLYPNPSSEVVYFEANYSKITAVEVYMYSGILGKRIQTFKGKVSPGQTISWNIPSNFPKGLYIYEIIENGKKRSGKLMKK